MEALEDGRPRSIPPVIPVTPVVPVIPVPPGVNPISPEGKRTPPVLFLLDFRHDLSENQVPSVLDSPLLFHGVTSLVYLGPP